jgi:hypothetical protein
MQRFRRALTAPAAVAAAATLVIAAQPQPSSAQQPSTAQQPSPAQQTPAGGPDFEKMVIKTTPVAGKVYLLEGQGGNIAVSAGIDAGKSLEEIQRAGLSPEWKDWAAGFRTHDHWIESVYRSLRQERE